MFRRRYLLWLALFAGITGVLLAPSVDAQDNGGHARGAGQAPPAAAPIVPLSTWVEDFTDLVTPRRAQSAQSFWLPGPLSGPSMVFEDDEPLFQAWELDGLAEVVGSQFESDNFVVMALGETQLSITAPVARRAAVVGFLARLRSMFAAETALAVTPLELAPAVWRAWRSQAQAGAGFAPGVFERFLARQPAGTVVRFPTVTSRARNGDQIAVSRLASRSYMRSIAGVVAEGISVPAPMVEVVDTGTSLTWRPWVVRDGTRVLLEITANHGRLLSLTPSEQPNKATLQLPELDAGSTTATLLAEPGKAYVVSDGRRPGDGSASRVTAFMLEPTIVRGRPKSLPGERIVPGLASRRYDVWELCLPIASVPRRSLRRLYPAEREGMPHEEDEVPEVAVLYYEEVPDVIEALCPDWNVVSAREARFSTVGGGYLELVDTPAAHASFNRALAALQAARPASFATELVVLRLTAAEQQRVPELRAANRVTPAPDAVLRRLAAARATEAVALDLTLYHQAGQLIAATRAQEVSYLADAGVMASKNAAISEPVVSVFDQGYSLNLLARPAGQGRVRLKLTGLVSSWDGKRAALTWAPGELGGSVEQPRLATAALDVTREQAEGAWTLARRADPADASGLLAVFLRTRRLK